MILLTLLTVFVLCSGLAHGETIEILTDEVFTVPLSPSTFNISDTESNAGMKLQLFDCCYWSHLMVIDE